MGARSRPAAAPVVALVLVALSVAVAVAVLGVGGGADLMPHGDDASRAALEAAGLRP